MSRLLFFTFLAVCLTAVGTFLLGNPKIDIRGELWRPPIIYRTAVLNKELFDLPLTGPVKLRSDIGESFRIFLSGQGGDYILVLSVIGSGEIHLEAEGGGNSRSRPCNASLEENRLLGGRIKCQLTVRLARNSDATVIITGNGADAVIDEIHWKVAAAKEHPAASAQHLLYGFFLLVVFGPAIAWLSRWKRSDPLVLTSLGFAWIFVTSGFGLIADLLIATLGYVLISNVAGSVHKRIIQVVLPTIAVVVALGFVKFIAPNISGSFANPGGFWISLPLGVSYFAIRIVDLIYKANSGTLDKLSVSEYLSFIFLPYTLPAGPILTLQEFRSCRIHNYNIVHFASGAARSGVGLTKKLLADAFLLPLISRLMYSFLDGGSTSTAFHAGLMLVLNTLYVYLDFSAYCDLAIGSARAGGHRLPENFNWPLLQTSMRRFWQRWHMTLTTWVMRRVYFPTFLYSRSAALSMFASMLVIGMWHAPILSWSMWAMHHTAILALESRVVANDPLHGRRQDAPATRTWNIAKGVAGAAFVWAWVSLGHSFTLFSNPGLALKCYFRVLSAPFEFGRMLVNTFL